MVDPLSAMSAWAINKITATAIDFASNKAKSAAQDFWNENFGSVATQMSMMESSLKTAITDASKRTVEELKEVAYANEIRQIATIIEVWTSKWTNAMRKAEKKNYNEMKQLVTEFGSSHSGAQYQLTYFHNLLMGEGSLVSGNQDGYIRSVEARLYNRLKEEDDYHIQHYYDDCKYFLSKIIRLQLIAFHFRCCAAEKDDKQMLNPWAEQLKSNIASQKAKIIANMPEFIRRIKPNFESEVQNYNHWWRFVLVDDTANCMGVRTSIPFLKPSDSLEKVPTRPNPRNEWKFGSPLLVDDDVPSPKIEYPEHMQESEEVRAKYKEVFKYHTRIYLRETQKSLRLAGSGAYWFGSGDERIPDAKHPQTINTFYPPFMFYGRYFKVVPVKQPGDGKAAAFKMIAMQERSDVAKAQSGKWFDAMNNYNPFQTGDVFKLEDDGIWQTVPGKPDGW